MALSHYRDIFRNICSQDSHLEPFMSSYKSDELLAQERSSVTAVLDSQDDLPNRFPAHAAIRERFTYKEIVVCKSSFIIPTARRSDINR